MAADGHEIEDLENRVDPDPHLDFEWRAFTLLSGDRSVGFGHGPIPWSAIDRYAERHGLDEPDEYARFVRLIRAMDVEFIGWYADKAKK